MSGIRRLLNTFAWQQRADLYIMILSTGVASVITLLAQMSLSYLLPPATYGEVRLIHGYFLLVVPLVMLALHAPLGRLCIRPDAENRWRLYWQVFIRRWWPLALLVTGMLGVLAASGILTQKNALNLPLALLFGALPVWALLEFYQYFWKFTRARRRASLALLLSKLGLKGGAVGGVLWWPTSYGFAAGFLVGGAGAWLALRLLQKRFLQRLPLAPQAGLTSDEKSIVRRFLPMALLLNALAAIALQLDAVFLDYMIADTKTAGLYGFALLFANAALLVQAPLAAYWLPELGSYYEQGWRIFLRRIFLYQAALTICVAGGAILIYLIVPLVVPYFFSDAYIAALPLLPLLLVRVVVQSTFGVLSQGLFVAHAMRLNVVLTGVNILLTSYLSWLWIPGYGVEGLIYAKIISDASLSLLAVMAVFYATRKMS